MSNPSRAHGPLDILEEAFVEEYRRGSGCSRELLLVRIESRTQYLAGLEDGRFT